MLTAAYMRSMSLSLHIRLPNSARCCPANRGRRRRIGPPPPRLERTGKLFELFETKATSLSLSASCAPEFSEASAHPVGLNPGMVIDALGPVRRGLGPGGPESTPRPSLTLRASPNTVQTRSATQLPAIRAHKDMLEVARSAQRYLNVTYPWSRRSLDA